MKKHIAEKIFILLLSATAVLSCSAAFENEIAPPDSNYDGTGFSLTASGTVSDIDDNKPLGNIKVTIVASEKTFPYETVTSKNTYTDTEGKYAIRIGVFTEPTSFSITAEDPDRVYYLPTSPYAIPRISWDSDYTMENNVFYVNQCNLFLKKLQ